MLRLLLVAVCLAFQLSEITLGAFQSESCYKVTRETGIATYYINRNADSGRRKAIEAHLSSLGLPFRRISAIEPGSSEFRLLMLEKPCKKNSDRDLAVIMSHLKAIYSAVHDPVPVPSRRRSFLDDYALILEDDVKFLYDVDFRDLIRRAPRKFGTLQLVTSNPEAVETLWYTLNTAHCCNTTVTYLNTNGANVLECAAKLSPDQLPLASASACADIGTLVASIRPRLPIKKSRKKDPNAWNQDDYIAPPAYTKYAATNPHKEHDSYAARHWKPNNWFDLSRNGRTALFWSAQAYIVNRHSARRFLADVVHLTSNSSGRAGMRDRDPELGFRLVNSFNPGACHRRPERPCVLGSCLHSYTYIFSVGQPTHVSMVPVFASTRLGLNSTIQPELFPQHLKAAAKQRALTAQLRADKQALLPSYLRVVPTECRQQGK